MTRVLPDLGFSVDLVMKVRHKPANKVIQLAVYEEPEELEAGGHKLRIEVLVRCEVEGHLGCLPVVFPELR